MSSSIACIHISRKELAKSNSVVAVAVSEDHCRIDIVGNAQDEKRERNAASPLAIPASTYSHVYTFWPK